MNGQPNYAKAPWKHPACWNGHIVKMTRDFPPGQAVHVATCECSWVCCAKVTPAGHIALDDAIIGHWLEVIAEAEAVPA